MDEDEALRRRIERRRREINSPRDLDAVAAATTSGASIKIEPEDAAMAMTNAQRQQRYRERKRIERADAVTRAIVTLPPRNVTLPARCRSTSHSCNGF